MLKHEINFKRSQQSRLYSFKGGTATDSEIQ